MELFESYDRRIKEIKPVMEKYGIKDFEDAKKICTERGFDPEKAVQEWLLGKTLMGDYENEL